MGTVVALFPGMGKLTFPEIRTANLPVCRCRRDWARFVGPRPGAPSTSFQACIECAARGMDLGRASMFVPATDPGPFVAYLGQEGS
jgi:hypothetical protein